MNKPLIILLLFIVLFVAGIYIFIPSTLNISEPVLIKSTEKGITRLLSDTSHWKSWNTKQTNYRYRVVPQSYSPIQVLTITGKDTIPGTIVVLPLAKDSVAVVWQCIIRSGWSPVERLMKYREAGHIKQDMETILASLQSFAEKPEQVYKLDIRNERVKDTLLMTTKTITTGHPSIADIYNLVSKLKTYIAKEGGRETNYPMLHVRPADSTRFEMMVAIPVDIPLKGNGDIFLRRMVPGNILVTEIKGGKQTIHNALRTLETYMNDYQKTSPAIPFESMVTDRSKEADTNKWITRLYYPVL